MLAHCLIIHLITRMSVKINVILCAFGHVYPRMCFYNHNNICYSVTSDKMLMNIALAYGHYLDIIYPYLLMS